MMPQQRSAAAFSRLGDSAVTKLRSVASICDSRGFKRREKFLGKLESGMPRCYQRAAIRAIRQIRCADESGSRIDPLYPRKANDAASDQERVSQRAGVRI
jgi:hypothetical protein